MASPAIVIVVVMGVAGAGKTTIGRTLAASRGWPFADADDFHPPANVAKMSAGVPLTDADRWPWLDRVAAWIDEQIVGARSAVVACSALKREYRDRLRVRRSNVRFVYLHGDRSLIERRLAARRGHFFDRALLDSQIATLEPPQPDEQAIAIALDEHAAPEAIVRQIVARLETSERPGTGGGQPSAPASLP